MDDKNKLTQTPEHADKTIINDLVNNAFSAPQAIQATDDQAIKPVAEEVVDNLNEEDRQSAQKLAEQIDPTKRESVLNFGNAAQQKIGAFSAKVLDHVQNQDTGPIGQTLSDLLYDIKQADPKDLENNKPNLFQRMFGQVKQSMFEVKARYQKVTTQIDIISQKLNRQRNILMRDNRVLDDMYAENKNYYEALNIFIAAGQLKMKELDQQIDELTNKQKNGEMNDLQVEEINDVRQFRERLDKRVYDLTLVREMTLQQAPQIRQMQRTNEELIDKIQTSINTAIPLWKNQTALLINAMSQRNALEIQRQVTQTTNDLLKKNSEMIKESAIDAEKENQRGVIDIETLTQTQNNLIETLNETLQIQAEGRKRREEASKQLNDMDKQLKDQLLNYVSTGQDNQN
ncbi:toxic anion resistance protein [Xylocopilactobacillus apicola]|uniref:Tellurite resistance protein n=1 Tax=Xylocopilactobacillus apicola TaxID=2932184 RepID=A0AAU9DQQ9_9LACO|nr:toxic anion resistance protein [Xylocopilactobacillus apicola]BDR58234.1 tellurite resistance protein [Xylocopilactobacillus apicola]